MDHHLTLATPASIYQHDELCSKSSNREISTKVALRWLSLFFCKLATLFYLVFRTSCSCLFKKNELEQTNINTPFSDTVSWFFRQFRGSSCDFVSTSPPWRPGGPGNPGGPGGPGASIISFLLVFLG